MDPLGALLNTLGANLLKGVFLETPCSIYQTEQKFRLVDFRRAFETFVIVSTIYVHIPEISLGFI